MVTRLDRKEAILYQIYPRDIAFRMFGLMRTRSIPPLWSDKEIEVQEDGYLVFRSEAASAKMLLKNNSVVEQPLLLNSVQAFLKELYPMQSLAEILVVSPEPLSEQEEKEDTPTEGAVTAMIELTTTAIETTEVDNDKGGQPSAIDHFYVDDATFPPPSDQIASPMAMASAGARTTNPETESINEGNMNKQGRQGKSSASKDEEAMEPTNYQNVYQHLQRTNNLANRIPPMIMDIQSFRDRPIKQKKVKGKGKASRRKTKVRASHDEPHSVRLVRTLNSIRAVYPHLLQIFNHKRRNDLNLKIGSADRKGEKQDFCWVLGTHVFDTASTKVIVNAHKDATLILEGLISVDLAKQISRDHMGGSIDFWTKSWIPQVQARAMPSFEDPLTMLTSYPDASNREAILRNMKVCDDQLHIDSTDVHDEELQAQYNGAVKKVHETISEVLKKRYPKSRISIYGSCLSNLSLGKGADVDLSLWLREADNLHTGFRKGNMHASKYEKQLKELVFQVKQKLKTAGKVFRHLKPIPRARVPVIKGTYMSAQNPYSADGSIK